MKNKITSSWRVPRNLDGQAAVPYLDTKWGLVDGRGQTGGGEGANCRGHRKSVFRAKARL